MTHGELDSLDNFLEKKDEEPETNESLSVVVPMKEMTAILVQLWKSRQTEPHIGKLYEKYKALIPQE
jgi:hypothetical protein